MKLKNLLKFGLPVISLPILTVPAVACTPTQTDGVELIGQNGQPTHFASIQEALKHATEGDTIKLNCDLLLKKTITIDSINGVTIDGDGHTILMDADATIEKCNFIITNSTNLTISNMSLSTTKSAGDGIAALNSSLNLNNVSVVGNYLFPVYFEGTTGGSIKDCKFASTSNNNQNMLSTVYVSSSSTGFTFENTIADSIILFGEPTENKKLDFLSGNKVRYIQVNSDSEPWTQYTFNRAVRNYSKIDGFLFGGTLYQSETFTIGSYFDSFTDGENHAVYIFDSLGLYAFNSDYSDSNTRFDGETVELHLMDDIDCSARFSGWTPIESTTYGQANNHLISVFNGHGHTISNLYIDDDTVNKSGIGFFGSVDSVYVSDVTFDNCRLEVKNTYQDAGMIIGRVHGKSELHHVTVSNSYIGAVKKVGSLVGVVYSDSVSDPELIKAWITLSACKTDNCSVVNKAKGSGHDVDVYLGGLVGWVDYHKVSKTGDVTYSGGITIDDDENNTTYVKDIHFNWQQDSEEWSTNFEVALLFLYGRKTLEDDSTIYRQCDSYKNVVVEYSGE